MTNTLKTDRLILRPWQASDYAAFWAMGQDAEVMEYLLPFADRAASDASAGRLKVHIETHGFGFWALEEKDGAAFIGFTGLLHVDADKPFAPAIEIGWRLARPYWGTGYASEAARASLTHGFETLHLDEIVALTVPANTRSQAVMQRIGMTRDPADDFDNAAVPDGSPLKRHVLYRIPRHGFRP